MRRAVLVLLALWPLTGRAGEDVQALLGRIRQPGVAEFRYEETRRLELASAPWHGQGYLFSSADGSLVKLQLLPKRVIMAIVEGRQMLYFDPEQKQRHAASVSQAGPAAAQITLFRAILQGHAEELKPTYDFAAQTRGQHWTLSLRPKPGQADADAPTVEFSGDGAAGKRRVAIRQPDGESTEYLLEKTDEGGQLEYSIQRLLVEAAGE